MKLELLDDGPEDQQSFAESHWRFAGLYDFSPTAFLTIDDAARIQEANVSATELLGCSRVSLIGQPLANFLSSDTHSRLLRDLKRSTSLGAVSTEITLRVKDEQTIPVRVSCSKATQGGAHLYHCAIVDLTEPKQAAAKLDALMLEYQAVLENAFDGVALVRNQTIARCNRRLEQMFGYAPGELIGSPIETLYAERNDWKQVGKFIAGPPLARNSYQGEHLMRRRDGSFFWCIIAGLAVDPIDPGKGSIWRLQDNTQRKEAEQALRNHQAELEGRVRSRTAELVSTVSLLQQEIKERIEVEAKLQRVAEELRDLYENAPCGYHSLDSDGLVIQINDTELHWLGYERDAVVGKMNFMDLIDPREHERFRESFHRLKKQGRVSNSEQAMMRRDGTTFPVLLSATAIADASGRFMRSRTSVLNLTERKLAEEALRDSEQRYRHLVEHARDIFYETDAGGHFIYFNTKAVFKLLRYTETELMGMYYLELVRPDWRERVEAFYREQFYHKIPNTYLEFPVLAKDGSEIWFGQNVQLVLQDGRVERHQAYCRDITERRQKEEELERSREQLRQLSLHLQSIREAERTRIAREIHDELGATLTAIKMDLSWVEKGLAPKWGEGPGKKLAGVIRKVDSAIQTVRRIATDLRPSILDNLGLWAAIEWQAQDMQERLGIEVKVEIAAPETEPPLDDDRATALFRIVQEALTNVARHARASWVRIQAQTTERDIIIRVVDNGRGIPESQVTQSKSWGLLGIYERARFYGGETRVTSARGQGTTVYVRLPVS
jgi:PAS domain S-box-containing protein